MRLSDYGWIVGSFAASNRFGFPGPGRWLRRVKGQLCNAAQRFAGRLAGSLLVEYDPGRGGAGCAARMGLALGGRWGAFCAGAGLLLPWLLLEAAADLAAPTLEHTPFLFFLLVARAILTACSLLGVMDFQINLTRPVELFLLLVGLADLFFDRFPATPVLLAGLLWQLARAGVFAKPPKTPEQSKAAGQK